MTDQAEGLQSSDADKKSLTDQIEPWARIFGTVAVPIVLAVLGWLINETISNEGVQKDYVTLAITILEDKKADPGLRDWAVDLLNKNTPIKLSPETLMRLKSGDILFKAGFLKWKGDPEP